MGDHAPAWEARTRCDPECWDVQYVYIEKLTYLCIYWRWEMVDHAPASEARTRCDRKF